MAKGSSYEREICRQLSLWWSEGASDFIFHRSRTSGAFATVRANKGMKTAGHCGDVAVVHKSGQKLIDLFTIEIKRGKQREANLHDMLDRGPKQKKAKLAQPFEELLQQTIAAQKRAGTPYWMLIHRRDTRQSMVYVPSTFVSSITKRSGPVAGSNYLKTGFMVRDHGLVHLFGTTLAAFCNQISPETIKTLTT